jgi:DNA-directed RNA polymerase I, II, and III subunit RPABC2
MSQKYEDDEEQFDPEDDIEEEEEDIVTIKTGKTVKIKTDDIEEIDDESEPEDTDIEEDNDTENDEDNDTENEDESGKDPAAESLKESFAHFDDLNDEDDDDDDDENYLQKFEENIQKTIIEDWHPELKTHNYDEIEILSRVVRDNDGNIIDPLHQTIPFITRYEKARILGERAKQINAGAIPMVEVESDIIDGYLIAMKEFNEKKIPFIIKRPMPNGGCEYWKFKDLEILQ